MAVVKSLWASIQGDPVFMRRVNGWLTIFWIVMIPVSMALGWHQQRRLRVGVVVVGLGFGPLVAWQAARVEVEQQAQAQAQHENPVETRVVQEIINRTDVSPIEEAAG